MTKGWYCESERHSLSAKGIKTNPRNKFVAFGKIDFVRRGGVFEGDRTLRVVGVVDGCEVGYVEVTYDLEDGEMELDSILVDDRFRKRGYADMLMNEALGFADENRLVTELLVEPFGGKWEQMQYDDYSRLLAEKERLRMYYRKFGFMSVGQGAMMVRLPET